LTTGGHHTRM